MCGVVAQLNFRQRFSPQHLRSQMSQSLSLLSHRGPDYSNQYWTEDYRCGLGHTRLSIQDLSEASHQPFKRESLVVSFNGEIYNFLSLRKELQDIGYHFQTSGDTEVLLIAYKHWGEKCFAKFNGMWGIAIWDEATQSLLVSRDRLGVKPLYFSVTPESFICASEISAFAPIFDVDPGLNDDYLNISLKFGSVCESLSDTLIENISKFPPGHLAKIDIRGQTIQWHRWWHPEDYQVKVAASYDERVEQFREVFNDALKIRNISDAKIAIALSGGLDSGAVAASMSNPFTAYTCDFKDAVSEADDAAKIMTQLNGKHELVSCRRPSLKHMLRCTLCLEDVCQDSHVGLDLIYQRMSEQGVKVSIEGHGGDETLAGYHHYHLCNLFSDIQNLKSNDEVGYFAVFDKFSKSTREHVCQYSLDAMLLSSRGFAAVAEQSKGAINHIQPPDYRYPIITANQSDELLQARLSNDLHFNTLPAILRNFDKLAMRHGIEIRSPFLDFRLIQFCRSLPNSDLISDGFSKRILRDAITKLPDDIRFQKRKMGFVSPFIQWCSFVSIVEWKWLLEVLTSLPDAGRNDELRQSVLAVINDKNFSGIRANWAQICAQLFFAKFTGAISFADLY